MASAANLKESEYLVTGGRQIVKLCNRIIASKKPISVYFSHSRETFSSLLFDLNPQTSSCFLDALVPHQGSDLLIAGKSASIQCNLDGVVTWFGAGEVLRKGSTDNHLWLEMALPTRAWYQQRRNAFRAQAFSSMELSLALYSRNREQPISAKIQDLSVSGCRAVIGEATDPAIEANEMFYRCQLFQAGNPIISCGAEVRHVDEEQTDKHDSPQLGLRFTDLTPQQDSVLSQLVMKLEISVAQPKLTA